MTTLFTKIINREIPGRFVYEDEVCVAFLTIEPLSPGHTLVVPRKEVEHWLELEPELREHLMGVSQRIGLALEKIWSPTRVALIIAGLEVPHLHLHVTGINTNSDLNFEMVDRDPSPEDLDEAARLITAALSE